MRGEPAAGATALFCVAPSEPPCFELRQMATRRIPHGHMLERRLLTPKGAGGFPLVLGNDVDGIVEDRGPGVTRFTAGTAVAVGRRVCWFLAAFFGAGLLVVVLSAPWLLR